MNREKMYKDELTLKDLILNFQLYFREVIKNWKLIIGVALVVIALFFYRAFSTPVTYKAELTFMVNEDDCLLYTSPSPRDKRQSRMPSSA